MKLYVMCVRLPRSLMRWTQLHHCIRGKSSFIPQVAVVGSGPAGFYTAQQLLKGHPSLKVDIYEKLPVPFGLVRFGVAPDHPEVKNCIHSFTQTAQDVRCTFFGNVEVGKDILVADLLSAYTAVVMCYGASNDQHLGIPGEDLPNVLSARSFVGWYNGLPENRGLQVDLDCETAVVLGHGNVALDVARILLMPVEILKKTDITDYALEILSKSKLKRVIIVGRRGPLQVAFTIKEFRELISLPMCRPFIDHHDVVGINEKINELPRPRRRLTELLYTTAVNPSEKYTKIWADATKEFHLKFLRSPIEIFADISHPRPAGVKFVINKLEDGNQEKQKAVPTNQTEEVLCGLVLKSIGYSGMPADTTVPFDFKRGVIPNTNGRVNGIKGLYCSGWIAKGPVFVILGTMNDAFATAKVILDDIASGQLSYKDKIGSSAVLKALEQKGITPVTFSNWEKIDKVEITNGERVGKPREKITSVEIMLQITRTQN